MNSPAGPRHLFAYGTLWDADIFAAVSGRALTDFEVMPGRLAGAEAVVPRGERFPVLRAGPGAADGLVIFDVPPEIWSRLSFYEGADYVLHDAVIALAEAPPTTALAYWPSFAHVAAGRPWDMAALEPLKPGLLKVIDAFMARYGTANRTEAEQAWADAAAAYLPASPSGPCSL